MSDSVDKREYSILITAPAESDLTEIAEYLAVQSGDEAVALSELEKLQAAVFSLAQAPERAPLSRLKKLKRKGFRVLVCEPYLIFYRVADQAVTVHRILHNKRDYQNLLADR